MIGYEDVKCQDCGNSQWTHEEEGFLVCSCGGEKEINEVKNPRLGKKQVKFWLDETEIKYLEKLMSEPCDLDVLGDIIKTTYQRGDYIK